MNITIDRICGHLGEIASGFTYSTGRKKTSRTVVWEVHAGGQVGLGENHAAGVLVPPGEEAPPEVKGTFDEVQRRLISEIAGPLIGRDPHGLEALLPALPRVPPVLTRRDILVIREGLSIALYDLVGKLYGIPMHALLGGQKRDRAPGMPVIHVAPPEVMVRRAKAWVDAGYRHLKIKFRGDRDLDVDVEALRAIRKTVGDDIELVVDANDGYADVEDAIHAIEALKPCNVYYFEDMLYEPLEAFIEMRKRTGAKVMVDLQATWPRVYDVARYEAADLINHHPNSQGGMQTALDIDAVAVAAGMETAIGSSGMCGIQDTAFQVLSSVICLTRPCEDVGLLEYYEGPTKGEYPFDHAPSAIKKPYPIVDGTIQFSDEPGLGIELDRRQLDAIVVDNIELT
jgi:L-alanine-DL-glutamate epimerase-like enolase superfamily enzyme